MNILKILKTIAFASVLFLFHNGEVSASGVLNDGFPWINSDLKANIEKNMNLSPKEDFHLYVNHDWLYNAEIPEGKYGRNAFGEVRDETYKKIKALIKDDKIAGKDAQLVKTLYRSVTDRDKRNKDGLRPVENTTAKIASLNSLKELSKYIADFDNAPTFVFRVYNEIHPKDASRYIVKLEPVDFMFKDAAEYKTHSKLRENYYEAGLCEVSAILMRLGFSKEQAKQIFDEAVAFETKVAKVSLNNAERYNPEIMPQTLNFYTLEELKEAAAPFPIADYLKGLGYGEASLYWVQEPATLKELGNIYREGNLDIMKSWLITTYILDAADKLDDEAYEKHIEAQNKRNGSFGKEPYEDVAVTALRTHLKEPLAKAYLSKYDYTKTKKEITDICQKTVKNYGEMLKKENWLTTETMEKALEKLSAIRINAVYPDKWRDYSSLDINNCSYMEAVEKIRCFERAEDIKNIDGKPDKDLWNVDLSEANAYYMPLENSINILLGILGGCFWREDMEEEELLGGIGAIIGHEISHAFDTNGAVFDKNGNYNDWWTEKDKAAFKERADKLINYYDNIRIYGDKKAVGKLVQTEAIADMTGVKSMLEIAKSKKDFDYKKFFTSYAKVWRSINTVEKEEEYRKGDPHPLPYLRTNVTLGQFDEFLNAFDINKGDGMYPKNRILVW